MSKHTTEPHRSPGWAATPRPDAVPRKPDADSPFAHRRPPFCGFPSPVAPSPEPPLPRPLPPPVPFARCCSLRKLTHRRFLQGPRRWLTSCRPPALAPHPRVQVSLATGSCWTLLGMKHEAFAFEERVRTVRGQRQRVLTVWYTCGGVCARVVWRVLCVWWDASCACMCGCARVLKCAHAAPVLRIHAPAPSSRPRGARRARSPCPRGFLVVTNV